MDALEILEQLCRRPTVSYYERPVADTILKICHRHGLNAQSDRWGNLAVGTPGWREQGGLGLAFVAHMDHPGFEAVRLNDDGTIQAVSHGGMPPAAFDNGTQVQIISKDEERTPGTVVACQDKRISPDGRFARGENISIEVHGSAPDLPCAVILDLPDFEVDSNFIRARSLDDLAGCATILAALIKASSEGLAMNQVAALFTRAEETGLIGARLAAADGLVPKRFFIVSVETSLKSESAAQGSGIVIRVGDRATTFDHHAELALRSSAIELERSANANFRWQRALMSAGGCEASAFKAFGYSVTGTSYPLGAWHNREEDGTLSPEYISIADFRSGVQLISSTMLRSITEGADDLLTAHPEQEASKLMANTIDFQSLSGGDHEQ